MRLDVNLSKLHHRRLPSWFWKQDKASFSSSHPNDINAPLKQKRKGSGESAIVVQDMGETGGIREEL